MRLAADLHAHVELLRSRLRPKAPGWPGKSVQECSETPYRLSTRLRLDRKLNPCPVPPFLAMTSDVECDHGRAEGSDQGCEILVRSDVQIDILEFSALLNPFHAGRSQLVRTTRTERVGLMVAPPAGALQAVLCGRAKEGSAGPRRWESALGFRREPALGYTAAVTPKSRRGLGFVATFCLVAVLAAAMVPAAGEPLPGVLASITCLDAPAGVRLPFVCVIDDPRDTLLPRCAPARGPPLV